MAPPSRNFWSRNVFRRLIDGFASPMAAISRSVQSPMTAVLATCPISIGAFGARMASHLARRGARARRLDREFSPEIAAMTSKTIVLKILDALIIAFLGLLALSMARLPLGWLARLFHMSSREFNGFSIFV